MNASPLGRTVLLAFAGVNLLDIAGPLQALEAAEPQRGERLRYDTVVASVDGGLVQTSGGLPIHTTKLADLDGAALDTILVGGGSIAGRPIVPAALVAWVTANAPRTRRICSICAGAFVLAAAGLLEGRRATTHWAWSGLLQQENPTLKVEPDSIFINDGKIWTSAGVTAGIDLTLALIEADYGHSAAIDVARLLVVFVKRPGGQAQYSVPLAFQSQQAGDFADLHAWMRQNLAGDLSVANLAAYMRMSERNFSRTYAARIGNAPSKTVEAMRFEAACAHIAESPLSLKQIAATTGFGSEQNLRRTFLRRLNVTPNDYKARFGRP